MTQNRIRKEVFAILTSMGIAERALTEKASFNKDLGLDSLDFAELVMQLETTFDVNIPILEAENIKTIQQAIAYIRGKKKN